VTIALDSPTTAGAVTDPLAPLGDPRSFISGEHWTKLVGLLMLEQPFDEVMAERVLGQAVA
jgi:hypothetical protein